MGMFRIFTDEEEKKQRKRAYLAKWRAAHKYEIAEYGAKWRAENPDYHKEYGAKYRAEHPEYNAKYAANHKEKIAEYQAEYQAEYYKTPTGRAHNLVSNYQREDKKYNRGKCTLTARWVIDNIFSKSCHYCGKEGWEIMGCDRIDNSLPHTPENVVSCCVECNKKRGRKSYEEFLNSN